jgi:hypothetical protein
VTIKSAPSKVSFSKSSLILGLGEKYDFNLVMPSGSFSYHNTVTADDSSMINIGSGIVVTALKTGTVYLSVKTFNNKTAVCKIIIKDAPTQVKCKPTSVKLSFHQTYKLSPYVNIGSSCISYTYKTSDKKVCTVSADGKVYAKDYGSCHINIYTYNHTSSSPIMTSVKFSVGYITHKISSYTTYFSPSYRGKAINLRLACKYINGKTDGYILTPGQVFSYNSAVGKRTRARGFVEAYVISGNDYVNGMGGGVCQGATTVFNTALLGNFGIVERSPHNLRSSYVPAGRDATVSWGSQDFKFRNNYNTSVRIKMTYNSSGSITCTVYSLVKVKVPKIALKVSYNSGTYTLRRYADGKVNYKCYSRYYS